MWGKMDPVMGAMVDVVNKLQRGNPARTVQDVSMYKPLNESSGHHHKDDPAEGGRRNRQWRVT